MSAEDFVSLNEIANWHPLVDVHVFIPFVHYRLQQLTETDSAILSVAFENLPITTRQLQISWDDKTPKLYYPPIQSSVVTEWAAYGIATIILPLYTDFRFARVTVRGEKFDYWVTDGEKLYGLEVSGMLQGDEAIRERIKRQQLLSNPSQVGGYVCIVHFGKATVQLALYGGE